MSVTILILLSCRAKEVEGKGTSPCAVYVLRTIHAQHVGDMSLFGVGHDPTVHGLAIVLEDLRRSWLVHLKLMGGEFKEGHGFVCSIYLVKVELIK